MEEERKKSKRRRRAREGKCDYDEEIILISREGEEKGEEEKGWRERGNEE